MKIVIATGVYPPKMGGPAQYAFNLEKEYRARGHQVVILTYGKFEESLPFVIRPIVIGLRMLRYAFSTDIVVSLDACTIGLPVAVVSKVFDIPAVVRVGGDFLWESYVEQNKKAVPLPEYYLKKVSRPLKHKLIFIGTKLALKFFPVKAFNSEWLIEIWKKPYGLVMSECIVIRNFAGELEIGGTETRTNGKRTFIWATRPLFLKNGELLRQAFEMVHKTHPDIVLDDKLSSHAELKERIKHCYAVVLPSISDVAPNLIYESIQYGKPFLVTKHTGIPAELLVCGISIDPLNVSDIARGLSKLCDDVSYNEYKAKIPKAWKPHSWQQIADKFLDCVKQK